MSLFRIHQRGIISPELFTGCIGLVLVFLFGVGFTAAGGSVFWLALRGLLHHENEMRQSVALLIFSLPFCAVGLFLLGSVLMLFLSLIAKQKEPVHDPGPPWMQNPEWATGRIRSSAKKDVLTRFGIALFWTPFGVVPLLAAGSEIFDKGFLAALVILFFPGVGILLFWGAWRAWLAWRLLGNTEFLPSPFPGVIGGVLDGVIQTSGKCRPGAKIKLILTCSQTSQGRKSRQYALWQDVRTLQREAATPQPSGFAIPVHFDIPFDCMPTDKEAQIRWRLDLKTRIHGTDVDASFNVPVFITPASVPDYKPAPRQRSDCSIDPALDEVLKAAAVTIEPLPGGGRRYCFRPRRDWGLLLAMFLFIVCFMSIAVLLWPSDLSKMFPVIVFPIIFSFLSMVLLRAMFAGLFWSGRVDVSPTGLVVASGIIIKSREIRIPAARIHRIFLSSGPGRGESVSQDIQGTMVDYNIMVETTAGKKITLGKAIPSRRVAEWLIAEMQRDLDPEMKIKTKL